MSTACVKAALFLQRIDDPAAPTKNGVALEPADVLRGHGRIISRL